MVLVCQEDCKVIKELGEGTYGKVTMRCIPVAVKEMKKPSDVLSLVKEQQMMARLRHPAIPAAMGWMRKNDGAAGLAIQYVDGMSMQQFREWVSVILHRPPVDCVLHAQDPTHLSHL